MYNKTLYFTLIVLLVIICNNVYGKKIKKYKRPKEQEELTTVQPNVVTYSTFGFNDVGSYDGFLPVSPEYSSLLSGNNHDSSTRLYAPAFPSAVDSTGFSENYDSQPFEGQTYSLNEESTRQLDMSQHTSNSNFLTRPNIAANDNQNFKTESEDITNIHGEGTDAPLYGTKLGNKHKIKPNYQINTLEVDTYNSKYTNPSDDKYFNFHEHIQEKPTFTEPNFGFQNINSYETNNSSQQENNNFGKPDTSNQNGVHFPRVDDFSNQHYPTDLDTSKLISDSIKHSNNQMAMAHSQIADNFENAYNRNKFIDNSRKTYTEHNNFKNNKETDNNFKLNTFLDPDTNNHVASHHKYDQASGMRTQQKKKPKPWDSLNYSNSFKDWKDSSSSSVPSGYGYSTNYSSMNFKYGVSEPKKIHNNNELAPASSNIVDFTSYQFPGKYHNSFKKMPEFKDEDYFGSSQFSNKFKTSDYSNQFRNSLSTLPTTTSTQWGNIFKTTDYSAFGEYPKKSLYGINEITHDDVVNIPKKQHNLNSKFIQNKPIDWSPNHYKSQKLNTPTYDWTKDFLDTRYKSEEDLLGLRTHDTSRPYMPNYNEPNNYKQLVDKWKQSYINSKYRDVPDNVGYWFRKPDHVPMPKPHPIEVPHPVIVPVPRPFPVRVPISKPVAVPVLQELTVPIEKPVPYPVYKNVPYPVEKLVPVPVEKEVSACPEISDIASVPVHVEKPYPVHIPYIRPVFHHSTKPVYEDVEEIVEEDYPHRPEFQRPSQYKKRPTYSSRNRTRRPAWSSYHDRNRRRWPDRRRPTSQTSEYEYTPPKPQRFQHSVPHRHRDIEEDVYDDEHRSYTAYCRKTGHC